MQWFEMYNISGAEMRLTVLFFNAADSVVGQTHFVTSGTTNAAGTTVVCVTPTKSFTGSNGAVRLITLATGCPLDVSISV